MSRCKDKVSYVCDICGKVFARKASVAEHKQRTHTVEGQQSRLLGRESNLAALEARRVNPRAFHCKFCDRSYTTNQRLKFHVVQVHERQKFSEADCTCDVCGKVLSAKGSTIFIYQQCSFQIRAKNLRKSPNPAKHRTIAISIGDRCIPMCPNFKHLVNWLLILKNKFLQAYSFPADVCHRCLPNLVNAKSD